MARHVLPGLMLVMLLGALDQTAMAAALPAVAASLGRFDLMPAVITAYLAAATVAMPLHGKLGDRFGRKPVLLVAIVVFAFGAFLCATATSMTELIIWRVVQGVGGGGLMIGAQAVLGEVVSPRERGRYLGLLGSVYVVAAVGGPLLGGLAVDHLTWRWLFALYPPLGLVALVVVARTLRLPAPPQRPPLDVLGMLLLSLTVTGVVLLGSGPGYLTPLVAVATVLAAAGWVATARRAADPVLPLRLFRTRSIAIPTAVSLIVGFTLFGTISYLPAFLQVARGASATQAGLVVTVLMAGVLLTTTVSGRIITRTGRYKAFPIAGTATAGLGMALLGTVGATTPLPLVLAALLLVGLGVGMVMQVMVLVAQNGAEHRDLGAATSAVTFLRQIGASAGVAAIGSLITSRFAAALPPGTDVRIATTLDPERLGHLPAAVRDAFGAAVPPVFGFVAPLLGLALVLAVALPAQPLRDTAHVTTSDRRRA
ncbi:EmrB/QacA subfamily drug resistance transporter [Pseudonocardia hierapolitana]|uniref:EmrB/QacA subfamily drug resistance transporter n=1 Tax=Pseudonocardia hierapolitana TaxID=1128676 RepID=A0A561SVK5_9PSEU|nr:MFS transporter [Pseudonocardia hierapolitana]TWF78861.1 EmrB/QacA subfamily drug resistance transporter [Pseudonocardia hierapolitana]